MSEHLTTPVQPDRSRIDLTDSRAVHYWTKHFKISKEDLQKAMDKVGNCAAAIRKELALD